MTKRFQFGLDLLLRRYQDVRWRLDNIPLAILWRPTERSLLRHYVKTREPVVVDIGANLGASVAFYRRTFPLAKIIAFEPDPGTYAHLARRHCRDVRTTLCNKGVGSVAGRLTLNRANISAVNSFLEFDSEAAWLKQFPGLRKISSVETEVVTLDDVAAELGFHFIDFVKCDTQGFEPEVIRGASQLLREKRIGLLKLEVLPGHFYQRTVSLYDLEHLLYSFDYKLCAVTNIHCDKFGNIKLL